MQTSITPELMQTNIGQRANDILRKCVHCGFCTATCPTYQLLGDELDGPRGRIYQIKQMLEGQPADLEIQTHLDRCLICRSCETTCPSGVDYAELIDIGREYIEQKNLRPKGQKFFRDLLGALLPFRQRNFILFKIANLLRPFLPPILQQKTPIIRKASTYKIGSENNTNKTVLLLEGCSQSTLSPNTNAAAVAVLQTLGYKVIREPEISCCGAVNQHLSQTQKAQQWVLKNLIQWHNLNQVHPFDAIVSTASGCGIMLKDYAKILDQIPQDTNQYQSLLPKIKDISELLDAKQLQEKNKNYSADQQPVSFHAPCTLNHGHRLADHLFKELSKLGYQLIKPQNDHLCCGSAGTYSLLQPIISRQLRDNKLDALQAEMPKVIITANVGCEHHLNSASETPVIHWLELVANDL